MRAQRDFNSAIGMSVLTGYFWLALRLLHQNVASTIISLLVKSNQLGQFSAHRQRLSEEFIHHIFNTAVVAILITVSYVVIEGLLSTKQELHVLLLTAAAVPFWFLMWLFLVQLMSNIRYINNAVLPRISNPKDYLAAMVVLVKLGLTNAMLSLGAAVIVPIFWFKKDIPSIDLFAFVLFIGALALYVLLPVARFNAKLKSEKKRFIDNIEARMSETLLALKNSNEKQNGRTLELLESEKETVQKISTHVVRLKEQVRLAAVVMLVPLSWGGVKMVELLVATPFTK